MGILGGSDAMQHLFEEKAETSRENTISLFPISIGKELPHQGLWEGSVDNVCIAVYLRACDYVCASGTRRVWAVLACVYSVQSTISLFQSSLVSLLSVNELPFRHCYQWHSLFNYSH